MAAAREPRRNRLLAALPAADFAALAPSLEPFALEAGAALYEPGEPQRWLYFPASGLVSRLSLLADGLSLEAALIGREGVVGVALVLGGAATPSRAVVQVAGLAHRIGAAALQGYLERGGALQQLLLRYLQALIAQMTQAAACNRHHGLEQQVCRWLLLALDRLDSSEVPMTQERLAGLLGVRREGVTEAAGRLHAAGAIEYHRGHIRVLDRALLEARACECYAVVRREYERLLPHA